MEVQVIWENGVLRPTRPLSLRHSSVTIHVPDEEIADDDSGRTLLPVVVCDISEAPDDVRAFIQQLRETRVAIMAQPLPQAHLTEEQRSRWEAFELRNATGYEQGRPA